MAKDADIPAGQVEIIFNAIQTFSSLPTQSNEIVV